MNAHVNASQLATNETINLQALRLDVRQAIATAEIAEFENQAYRLGHVIATGLLVRAAAGNLLLDIATAQGLVRVQGDDVVQSIIANGLDLK